MDDDDNRDDDYRVCEDADGDYGDCNCVRVKTSMMILAMMMILM